MLCLTCKRVRPARSPEEYTVLRAYSITMYGLCTCAQPDAWQPDLGRGGLSGPTAPGGSRDAGP